MAKGSFNVSTSNKYIKGKVEWSSSTNVSGNYSNVTASLRLSRTNTGYTTWGDGTFYIRINGVTVSNSKSFTIKYNSNTLMVSGTVKVPHNSDGTKSITISAWGSIPGAGLSMSTQSGTAKLDTIPRASTMTTSRNWTAGSNRTVSISRASSSFSHRVYIDVANRSGSWINIKRLDFTTSQTSKSTSFTTAENTKIFDVLDGRASASSRMRLYTYSGSTQIGLNTYTGTVTAPSASTAKITNPTGISSSSGQGNSTVYIDQSIGISITRHNSRFTHTLVFKDGNSGNVIHTATGVGTSYTWTPTASQRNQLYQKASNTREIDGQIDITTYYNGEKVRSTVAVDINFRVRNSEPTFGTGFVYKDTNSTTTAITGNNQYIIQNQSNLVVEIPESAKATPRNYATMSYYDITVNGVTKRATYKSSGTVSVSFGKIDASSNISVSIKAVDSRGLSTTRNKTINIIPYSLPTVTLRADRVNGFESDTVVSLSGSASPLNIGGTNRNSIVSATYRYREQGKSYGSSQSFSITGFPKYSAQNIVLDLDNSKTWELEVTVKDRLGTRVVTRVVDTGKPIFFIDPKLKSLGFGDYPSEEGEFRINGRLVFGATFWADTSGLGEGVGAIELNNSDIVQANAIYFNDVSQDNNGEGFLFLKSGYPSGSMNKDHHDNLLVRNGIGYLNGMPAFSGYELLWTGAAYPNAVTTITMKRKLSECAFGWILVWSDFDPGAGANDFNWAFSFIPRDFYQYDSAGSTFFIIPRHTTATPNHTVKTLYINNDTISGHEDNNRSDIQSNDVVLRRVYAF